MRERGGAGKGEGVGRDRERGRGERGKEERGGIHSDRKVKVVSTVSKHRGMRPQHVDWMPHKTARKTAKLETTQPCTQKTYS